ncbi:MAG: hypothetical protein ACJ8CR_31870 [Roseiflexaceae bacterium]
MINAQVSSRADSKPATQIRHLSQRGFWLLFVLEGLFIAGMLLLVLNLLLPARAPLAQTGDYATVRAAIQARLNGAVDDPLIEVAPGVTASTSAVGGFTLNGYIYYYYREGQRGFDPLSRGAIARDQVELVSREQIGREVIVIYRVLSKQRATS